MDAGKERQIIRLWNELRRSSNAKAAPPRPFAAGLNRRLPNERRMRHDCR